MCNAWIPPLLTGIGVGAAVRYARRGTDLRFAIVVTVLTLISCVAGYIAADYSRFTPFMLGESINRMLNDIFEIVLIAVAAYLSFAIASRSPEASSD